MNKSDKNELIQGVAKLLSRYPGW